MKKIYKIGKYEFDSYEDYSKAKADVKKIYELTHAVDIYDPKVALRIYQGIRDGKIVFHSAIGKKFFLDLVEIVAKNSEEDTEISRQKRPKKTQEPKQKRSRHKRPRQKLPTRVYTDRGKQLLGGLCLVLAILCFAWYFISDYTNRRGNSINEYLNQLRSEPQQTVEMVSNDTFFAWDAAELEAGAAGAGTAEVQNPMVLPNILPEYEPIYRQNPYFAGWITIADTKVDYPVMRTDSSYFYLNHNFNGEEDINGTLFMDARTDLAEGSTNTIIYGHNMKSGEMFGGLKKYLEEDYWKSHKKITFDTIYEKGTYEIFAVCLAQVHYQDDNSFRYYDFIHAGTEQEFNDYIQNILQLSVFADQELPVYGDTLLTLSTCNNYVEDGRLFVIAKKCKDAE